MRVRTIPFKGGVLLGKTVDTKTSTNQQVQREKIQNLKVYLLNPKRFNFDAVITKVCRGLWSVADAHIR